MNIYQRIVLIVGAVALLIALLTTPKYVQLESGPRIRSDFGPIDPGTALVRGFATLGVTALLFLALNTKKKD